MTDDCNAPLPEDILAAREIVKTRQNPAHWPAIDRGEWDPWGAVQGALVEMSKSPPPAEEEAA